MQANHHKPPPEYEKKEFNCPFFWLKMAKARRHVHFHSCCLHDFYIYILICRRKKHDHVTPLLKELHWLPIHVRPTYKLLTIAYSVMHGLAPEYLAELLDRHHPRRVLKSASAELFSVPFSQTVRHGDRHFSVAVATLWNQLPNSVRIHRDTATFQNPFENTSFLRRISVNILQCKNISHFMEYFMLLSFFFFYLLEYIIFIYSNYVYIIFLYTNLPCFVKRPRAIVIDWALYNTFIIIYKQLFFYIEKHWHVGNY